MDINDLEIGTEGSFIASFEKGIGGIQRIEKNGYDSVWFADDLMGWIPDSIWTPDLIDMATVQKSPHEFYDVFQVMAVAAWNTSKIKLGTSVTEIYRHHPAVLAQTFLTLDNISKGRTILGIGAGEGENVIPYGIKWENPVGRLEEAIKIMKLLWESDNYVNFDGKYWKLKNAVLSMKPFEEGKYPPIWIAANREKMCEMTGRIGDGWLPLNLDLDTYKENLNIIQTSAKKAGRSIDEIIPGLWCLLIIDDDHSECDRLLETAYAKNYALVLHEDRFKKYGKEHPLGKDFYGLLDYIPTNYDRKQMLNALDKVPHELCEDFILHGTPDEIISQIEDYMKIGMKHLVLYNITYACDMEKVKSSFGGIKKVMEYFKG
jgi:phthiodiolone/phenolphthiodiolone dimycocerosates ketoreductase